MVKQSLSRMGRAIYVIPIVGVRIRRLVEFWLGHRYYQDRAFWNDCLKGWASPYLGGTLSIDLRNSITVLLAKQVAPTAKSILDLGCAGATLALCLGPEYDAYCGVDISDVAISKAREHLSASTRNSKFNLHLEVFPVQDYQPTRQYDIIIFNEVLYYLSLNQITVAICRYSKFLSPGGVILISLKDHELCRCVQAVIMKELKFEYGVLYQQQPERPGWKTVRNRETPAYLVQAFKVMV